MDLNYVKGFAQTSVVKVYRGNATCWNVRYFLGQSLRWIIKITCMD